jgi:uncharacterized protein (TIGR00299 family) protein
MASLLYVDATCGASGDMILGALVDLGVPFAHLRRSLDSLPLEGYTIRSRKLSRCGLAARKIDVRVRGHEHGRDWKTIRRILNASGLETSIRTRALAIFRRLIEAEAEAHGQPFERVHLHEAGGTDAIVDVVGASIGLAYLQVDRILVSCMTTGFGTVACAHGSYPVPGPATLNLAQGVPIRAGHKEVERLTPTGAAILTTVADGWGEFPEMRPRKVGYGAGDRDLGDDPNCLRMIVGETDDVTKGSGDSTEAEGVVVIECTIDDSTPQRLAYACERLLEAGALDVFTTAVTMKKGRSGHQLTVLARPALRESLSRVLLLETSTLGLRFRFEKRVELHRRVRKVRTPYGIVRVKTGEWEGALVQVWPEYADCAAIATRREILLEQVQQAALRAFHSRKT